MDQHRSSYKHYAINVGAADTEMVAAAVGQRHVVHGLVITGDAAGIIALVSDGSGDTEIASFRLTALTAAGALGHLELPFCEAGWCKTAENEALDLRLTTTANADGVLIYSTIDAGEF